MPEIETGQRIARELSHADLLELIELDRKTKSQKCAVLCSGKTTIDQLGVRRKCSVTILLMRSAEHLIVSHTAANYLPQQQVIGSWKKKQIQIARAMMFTYF